MIYSDNADLIHVLVFLLGFSTSLVCGFLFLRR